MPKMAPLQARITPMERTVPGIEYGSTEMTSRTSFPFGLIFWTTYATSVPRNIQTMPAVMERKREFLMESSVPFMLNTFWYWANVKFSNFSGRP